MSKTKAEMLQYLRNNIPDINVLPVYVLDSTDYTNNKAQCLDEIIEFANNANIVVRSSSRNEDNADYSNAGKFNSILDVKPTSESIESAVDAVLQSYGKIIDGEQVLVQPMLKNVIKSGVVFTADLTTYADYYTVNYCEGDDTAGITSGRTNDVKTFVKYKKSEYISNDSDMESLLLACKKIESFLDNEKLDIEFAIDADHNVYILQVRNISVGKKKLLSDEKIDITVYLNRIAKKVRKLSTKHPFLLGDKALFGVMPDWNPAEILGSRPKKLAISLYKELITDNVWAKQRSHYGYRDLTMHPLMTALCGVPYIDTRIMFNSFIPKKLDRDIANKLVNYYLQKLEKFPKYHDKVEFEIVFSCYYLGLSDELAALEEYGFNKNEIKRIEYALLDLTNQVIDPEKGLCKKDLANIPFLQKNYLKIVQSDISDVEKIYWLIEICKKYGTLPFAGIARAAFIAVQLLKSLVNKKCISPDRYNVFMQSLSTISKNMKNDTFRYYNGEMPKSEFLSRYGHIRPGTYDITSQRYDEAFEEYFGSVNKRVAFEEYVEFTLFDDERDKINRELKENGLLIDADSLIEFIRTSIEGREYSKFEFTKTVSDILKLLENIGKRSNISRADLAHLDITVVKQLYVDLFTGDVAGILKRNIDANKEQYQIAKKIKLPSLIVDSNDVFAFKLLSGEPNFVTQNSVEAETVVLDINSVNDVKNKIVFIKSADPGYDFIFSKDIAGLVTQFGGANSHMAIRCAELNIPAVIGVGELNFNKWKSQDMLFIDCLNKQVRWYGNEV